MIFTLFVLLAYSVRAQTSGVIIDQAQPSENVFVCGDGSDMFIQLQAEVSGLDSFVLDVDFPAGVQYTGQFSFTSANLQATLIDANPDQPMWSVKRVGGGTIGFGSSISMVVNRAAYNCELFGSVGQLKDVVTVTSSQGVTTDNSNFNFLYQSLNPVLSIINVDPSGNVYTPGSNESRTITITNGGDGCLDTIVFTAILPNVIDLVSMDIGGGVLTPTSVQSSGSNEVYTFGLGSSDIPGGCLNSGDSLTFNETTLLAGCFTGNRTSSYRVNYACGNTTACQSVASFSSSNSVSAGTEATSVVQTVVDQGDFCGDASNVRVVFTNTSVGADSNFLIFNDACLAVLLTTAGPYSVDNFTLNGVPATVSTTAVGNATRYVVDLDSNAVGAAVTLMDRDGDGVADDMAIGDSVVIEYELSRACLPGCTSPDGSDAEYVQDITSQIAYLSGCDGLAGTTTKAFRNVGTTTRFRNTRVGGSFSTNRPNLVTDLDVSTMRITGSRVLQGLPSAFFDMCQAQDVLVTFVLSSPYIVDGNAFNANGTSATFTTVNDTTYQASLPLSTFLRSGVTYDFRFDIPIVLDPSFCSANPGVLLNDPVNIELTVEHDCHGCGCAETFLCYQEAVTDMPGLCSQDCGAQFINVSRLDFVRANYGYQDELGTVPVVPDSLSQRVRSTVLFGDTVIARFTASPTVDSFDSYAITVAPPTIDGIDWLTPVQGRSYVNYFFNGDTIRDCVLPDYAIEEGQDIFGRTTYRLHIDTVWGDPGHCLGILQGIPVGAVIETYFHFVVNEVPTSPSFELGDNRYEIGLAPDATVVGLDSVVNCSDQTPVFYYNYELDLFKAINVVDECDELSFQPGFRVISNGITANVFDGEVRPLFYVDSVTFTLDNLDWFSDSFELNVSVYDTIGVSNTRELTPANNDGAGRTQRYGFEQGVWPVGDELGAQGFGTVGLQRWHQAYINEFKVPCTADTTYRVDFSLLYKRFPGDTARRTFEDFLAGSVSPDLALPSFTPGGSTTAINAGSFVETWRARYTGDFNPRYWVAIDTTINDAISVQDITVVGAPAGVTDTLLRWDRGVWLQVTDADTAFRLGADISFDIDFTYACEPQSDSAWLIIAEGCDGFPVSPLDASCGYDSLLLTINKTESQLDVILDQVPAPKVDLCDTLFYELRIVSQSNGNVLDPMFFLDLPDGITFDTLNLMARYPDVTSSAYEPLAATIMGDSVFIDLTQLANLDSINGLPGTISGGVTPANRTVRLQFGLVTGCEFTFGTNFQFVGLGLNGCGEQALNSGVPVETPPIRSFLFRDYEYRANEQSEVDTIKSCLDTLDFELDVAVFGLDSTLANDTISFILPQGLNYLDGSFNCMTLDGTDPAHCLSFVGVDMDADGLVNVVAVGDANGAPPGARFLLSMRTVPVSDFLSCDSAMNVLRIRAFATLNNVPCGSTGHICSDVSEEKFNTDVKYVVALPELMVAIDDYQVDGGSAMATSTVSGFTEEVGASDSILVQYYCVDPITDSFNTLLSDIYIPGPIPIGGSITVSDTFTQSCALSGTIGVLIDKDPIGSPRVNCICNVVADTVELARATICPSSDTAECAIAELPPYSDARAFVDAGGTLFGYTQPFEELNFQLIEETTDSLACDQTLMRTYEISDTSGNTNSCTQTVFLENAGRIDLLLSDTTIVLTCGDVLPAFPVVNVVNACDTITLDTMISENYTELQPGYERTIMIRVEDACGYADSATLVYRFDGRAPLWTVQADDCDPVAGTYAARFVSNASSVTSSAGVISSDEIVDIPVGQPAQIIFSNGLGCVDTVDLQGPVSCPVGCELPNLSVGNAVCEGATGTYAVTFTEPTSAMITSNVGTLIYTNEDSTSGVIQGIAAGDVVTVVASNGGDCVVQTTVSGPIECGDTCDISPYTIGGALCASDGSTRFDVYYSTSSPDVVMSGFTTSGMVVTVSDTTIGPVEYTDTLYIVGGYPGCTSDTLEVISPETCPDCQEIVARVFLEGPYDESLGRMYSLLHEQRLLPGQNPQISTDVLSQLLGVPTPIGQPYNRAPWNWAGIEGDVYGDAATNTSPARRDYPATAVDWVFVSVRTDATDPGSVVFECAMILLEDGTIVAPEDCACLQLNQGQDYYMVIEHRNHLAVMSEAVQLQESQLSWDFSSQDSWKLDIGSPQEVGQKMIGAHYVMLSGNNDQAITPLRGDINAIDYGVTTGSNFGVVRVYLDADSDMNGDVNAQDLTDHIQDNFGLINFVF